RSSQQRSWPQPRQSRTAPEARHQKACASSPLVYPSDCPTDWAGSGSLRLHAPFPFTPSLAGTRGYLMATATQVLVVGEGPAVLLMRAELNRHGVSCRIVDKNDGPTHDSRAASIQARTLEILDSVGLADEFVQVGNICHAAATYTSDHKLIKYLTFDELD